jgi:uncharacterized protein
MSRSELCLGLNLAVPGLSVKVLAGAFGVVALLLGLLAAEPAKAQQGTTPVQRSYVNPFPTGDRYRVLVLGDSLGDGLWTGLYRAFEDDNTIEFVKHTRPNGGLVSGNWESDLNDALKDGTYQIAVIMYGANDDQSMKVGKDWVKVGTDPWRQAYGEHIETVIKKLRAANLAIYWVGLPIMRSPTQSADAEFMNQIFREKAFINGAKYVDVWNGFMDEGGRFSAYGPDMTGQAKRLRADDGVLFTMRGNVKLASYVEKELRHDLTVAKQERNIPLAGDVEEQAKVSGHDFGQLPSSQAWPTAMDEASAEPAQQTPQASDAAPAAAQGSAADQAAPMKQSQVGDVSVVRPAIDTALQTAQQVLAVPPGATAAQETEMITSELGSGLTAVATLSSVTDISLASSKPRLPLSQRPYYKVLIKGEQPKPKAGRGDDFTWPPS